MDAFDAKGGYFTAGLDLHCGREPCTVSNSPTESSSSGLETDDMKEKLVLPPPMKVLHETLSPVLSQGKCAESSTFTLANTLIIFDWDSALLCTCWLSSRMGEHPSAEQDKHLSRIAQQSKSLLEASLTMGQTYIMANAVPGWVEHSATVWVPEMLPLLRQVPVIAARDTYQHPYTSNDTTWETQAFVTVRNQLGSTPIENLLLLGNSEFEMAAVQAMKSDFPLAHIKTVQFQPQPTAPELLRQVEVVAEKLGRIVRKPRSLKVVLARKVAVGQQ